MILQALVEYYDRKTRDPDSGLAPFGFEWKEIPFVLVLRPDGTLLQIEDTRTKSEGAKKAEGRRFLVPKDIGRTSGIAANLLWDKAEYSLGIDVKNKPEKTAKQFAAFQNAITERLSGVLADAGIGALLAFLQNLDLSSAPQELVAEIKDTNPYLTFRLSGDTEIISNRKPVLEAIRSSGEGSSDSAEQSLCILTGQRQNVAKLHHPIKGVWGAKSSGASIVSFNLPAFASYHKSQGDNAPISEPAAFAYTTALNHLLAKGSRQRLQVGDASTVFWSERENNLENSFATLLEEPSKDDPDARTQAIQALFKSVHTGAYTPDEATIRFYVLGLGPNAARIAIRTWQIGTVQEMAGRIQQFFEEIDLQGQEKFRYPSLWKLLTSTASLGKTENIPPNLAADTLRAILAGSPYPATLLQAAVRRCRAEQAVPYARAALLKAVLNRIHRLTHSTSSPRFPVALDPSNTNPGYLCGRFFACLEKAQEEALPGLNATIRDRYYGAASTTPASVFPLLIRTSKHHLAKLEPKAAGRLERINSEIVGLMQPAFPPMLSLADQGAFAIGYYHQRQSFFTKKESSAAEVVS